VVGYLEDNGTPSHQSLKSRLTLLIKVKYFSVEGDIPVESKTSVVTAPLRQSQNPSDQFFGLSLSKVLQFFVLSLLKVLIEIECMCYIRRSECM
jgi:hypothetical protein